MKASNIVTATSIWGLEGLIESKWSLLAAVEFFTRVLDMTDTDALRSLAVIKVNQKQCVRLYMHESLASKTKPGGQRYETPGKSE